MTLAKTNVWPPFHKVFSTQQQQQRLSSHRHATPSQNGCPPISLPSPNPSTLLNSDKTPTMSVAPIANHSLHPTPPLQRAKLIIHSFANALSFRDSSSSSLRSAKRSMSIVVRASSATEPQPSKPEGGGGGEELSEDDNYEVELDKPYGLKFAKGRDGGTYIDAIAPGGAADKTGMFSIGDKVIATSAVFGTEIWPAAEYGRTMYTVRQRIGPLLMKMQKRYGKPIDEGELTDKEIIRAERNSGVVSSRVREIQMQNYMRKMEQKQQRESDLREGLKLYKAGKYEEALEKFESVLGSKPELDEASIASYNVACCYSKLNQVQAGLSALEDALKAGYEEFKTIRSDPDLANLRASEEFEPLLKKYDESFINEGAINAIKSLFGIFNKD